MLKKDKHSKDPGAWCGLNHPDLNEAEADITIFGIPYDKGVSYRSGAGQGPEVLRENTFTSSPFTERLESMEGLRVFDGGDFLLDENEHGGGNTAAGRDAMFKEIEEYVCRLVQQEKMFTMIGGDHSVTIPVEAGINKALDEPFGIIHIDAHMDLCDEMGGDQYSHGAVQRRGLELSNISGPENFYFVGIRSIEPDEHRLMKQLEKEGRPLNVMTAWDCYHFGINAIAASVIEGMSKFNKVYVTFDIDALDPAYAAGTGTPQLGGLTGREGLELMRILFKHLNIIGFDVVEVAPPLDPALTSMFAARKIVTESWGHWARKAGKLK